MGQFLCSFSPFTWTADPDPVSRLYRKPPSPLGNRGEEEEDQEGGSRGLLFSFSIFFSSKWPIDSWLMAISSARQRAALAWLKPCTVEWGKHKITCYPSTHLSLPFFSSLLHSLPHSFKQNKTKYAFCPSREPLNRTTWQLPLKESA